MDNFKPGQIERTVTLLQEKLGIQSRDDLVAAVARVDKRIGPEAWKHVGDVREDLIEWLLSLAPADFTQYTGLPEHDAQPAILPQDSPEG